MSIFTPRFVTVLLALLLLSTTVTQSFLRSNSPEPGYLKYVSDDVRKECLARANSGEHNIAFLGGADAEYFVALEDCVREEDPGAFEQVR